MSSTAPDTRQRILQATLELLEESRGQGVRMSDIAKRARISRQALYLHFETRAKLMIATTFYLDELKGAQGRLLPSRTAKSGVERLDAYIEAWASYLPELHGAARALLAMGDTDDDAKQAWDQRMQDMREGCAAAIAELADDGKLSAGHSTKEATDILWMMLQVRNWELLTTGCGWSQQTYVANLKTMARRLFVSNTTS
ncbi:MAG: TetR/AcrR family transcriptional regulator [Rhodospirillaceae bacterium]|jgi:AcrR family transcriptional regulator|nr:TetR/AcrR family transcriptional regulator [Rhodospirillaceae bacterium]MBT6203387.1 TetR/AcrR family transcriptional regulator [Rhodospirillaceae bacterium]MBT6509980.1 TetR/AcrR family transcriptional regulator [Rhodospirillaceae bacterium]MBT7646274.1 TetR/AcrR family transcriptional regulator [Rhodospirillaceae bacterium]